MLKAERDNAISRLSDEHRQDLRRMVTAIQDARAESTISGRAEGWPSARELLAGRHEALPAEVRAAVEAILVRDETGPKVGEEAPDFHLKRLGSEERVSLSDFRGRRPVALAFGSYT